MKWEKIEFGELYLIPSKNGLNRPSRVRGNGYKMINMGELFANDRIKDIPMELVPLNDREIESSNILEQDLLFARQSIVASGAGKCSIVLEVAEITTFESHLIRVRLNTDKANPLFYYYYFKTPFANMKSLVQQGVQAGIRGSELKNLSVFYPPLPTQRKIASILSAYDDLIENNLKRIKLLEEKLMIEYSLLEEDSKNLKEFDFSNFVTFVKGIEPGSSNYLSEKSDGTLPFIRVGDLSKRDSDIFVEESKTKGIISNPNDVLISMDGTIGIVRYGIYGCYSSGIRKAVSNGVLNNAFIFCYLSSKKIQGVIYSHSKGSTIQHAGSSISHFKVKLPKETSLNNFIKFSNPIFDMMNNLLKQNTKLREARDILLPKLMNRQIEV